MRDSPDPERDFHQATLDDENTRRLLRLFVGLTLGSSLVYLAALPFSANDILLRGPGVIAAFLCALAALVLLKRGNFSAAAQFLLWGVWGAFLLQICITNGLMSRSLMAVPILIVLAGWLLPARGAVALTAACLLAGLALALGERAGLLPLTVTHSPPLLVWLAYAIYVVMAAVVAYHIFRGFRLRHEALAEREAELQLLMKNVPVMIFHGDRTKRCLFANRSYAEFFAAADNSLVGKTVREIIGEEAYQDVDPRLERTLAGERLTYRGIRQSPRGEERVLDIELLPEQDGKGGTKGFFAMINDVTVQVHAEEELRRSENKFASVFRSSPLAITITRLADDRYLDVNDAFVRMFGWSHEEAIGRSSLELGKWETPGARPALEATLRQTGRINNMEMAFRTRAGELRHVLFSAERIDMSGEPCALVVTADITERKQAEAALRESREEFAKIFRASPVTIIITHMDSGRYLDVNDAFSKQFGWAREEAIGRSSVDIGIWPSREERDEWVGVLREHGTLRDYEVALRTKSGTLLQTVVYAETIEIGGMRCVISLIHDITRRKRAEEEVLRLNADLDARVRERTAELTLSNKELESFAYSISHDLRAPLRGIDGFSKLLLDEYQDKLDAQGRGYLDRVRRAAQRMGELIDDILELSRVSRHSMRHEQVDLSRMATEILDELARAAPQRKLAMHLTPDCMAYGDPQLLRVLLQNLLENAWKYTGRKDEACIEFGCESADGEQVFFVRDNGVGFDMKYAERLFSPFQRLHSPEEFEGTGIGLATVARVAHRHGGRVWAESALDRGTVLRFTLGGAERNYDRPAQ